jgi:hypothetical protein
MTPEEKLKLELMLKETQSKTGNEWMDRFKKASPKQQYYLTNILEESFPIKKKYYEEVGKKASQQMTIPGTESSYDVLMKKEKGKKALEEEKNRIKAEIEWLKSGA